MMITWTVLLTQFVMTVVECTMLWSEWWTYEGVSGPDFWGVHNTAWALCEKGKFQSPININPKALIYDPNLKPLRIDNTKVDGNLINTGHDITYEILADSSRPAFKFSGGPLSYTYKVEKIKLHFGIIDEFGSEHTVAGNSFPLEIQIIGYNAELYQNYSDALFSTHGLSVLSVFGVIDTNVKENEDFNRIVDAAKQVRIKDSSRDIYGFSLADIIPPSDYFITYEGSLTQPSCQETVTWILINKPLHISKDQINALRLLTIADESSIVLMENNFRPPMPLNRRPVRTNINPYAEDEDCSTKITMYYKDPKTARLVPQSASDRKIPICQDEMTAEKKNEGGQGGKSFSRRNDGQIELFKDEK